MVHVERTIEPDKARHEEYGFFMDRSWRPILG
jgi:hypothetical protein